MGTITCFGDRTSGAFLIGNLSTDDGNARDDAWEKVDLNFTLEFRK